MKKENIVKGILAIETLSLFLCGCQKKEIEYNLETQIQHVQEESPLELESREPWKEEFTITGENGSGTVTIDSHVAIPDVEQMSVVELQENPIDEEYKKMVIQQLFGHLEVYSDDEEDWSKAKWQMLIDKQEEHIQLYEEEMFLAQNFPEQTVLTLEDGEHLLKIMEEELAHYKKGIKNAPDVQTVVTEFSADSYIGNYNSSDFQINFNNKGIIFRCGDYWKICQEELKDSRTIMCHAVNIENYEENICSITEEEAKKQAENALRTIGWTEPVWKETQNLYWEGHETGKSCIDGYVFECYQGTDGLLFGKFDAGYGDYHEITDYEYGKKAEIYINDMGIIELSIEEPVKLIKKTEDVKLLPLETVQGIIRKELEENADYYLATKESVIFKELELNYIPVKNKTRDGYYSYVPAWRICTSENGDGNRKINVMIVNAMDGSIIRLEDIRLGEKENE